MLTSPPSLTPFTGKKIGEICSFSLGKNNTQNHCAHFVSHVMEYEFSETCKNFTFTDKQAAGKGATIRVERLFNVSPEIDIWTKRPLTLMACLIFVTISSNVRQHGSQLIMGDNPRKHVGIYNNGTVWNYSNTHNKVMADPEKLFIDKFKHSYRTAGQTVEFFYGRFLK